MYGPGTVVSSYTLVCSGVGKEFIRPDYLLSVFDTQGPPRVWYWRRPQVYRPYKSLGQSSKFLGMSSLTSRRVFLSVGSLYPRSVVFGLSDCFGGNSLFYSLNPLSHRRLYTNKRTPGSGTMGWRHQYIDSGHLSIPLTCTFDFSDKRILGIFDKVVFLILKP